MNYDELIGLSDIYFNSGIYFNIYALYIVHLKNTDWVLNVKIKGAKGHAQ